MVIADNEGRESEVHAWRASTVKTLVGSAHAREKIRDAYEEYVEDHLSEHCKDFVRPDIQQADWEDLVGIVAAFGDFAIELWSQKYHVQYFCLNFFEDKLYRVSDNIMELAPAVGVEDGDASLDGRPIPCLVQPLIVGFGSHDGKDYDKGRVWSRAVVWVSKEASLRQRRRPRLVGEFVDVRQIVGLPE
jgi:hypothetical protein